MSAFMVQLRRELAGYFLSPIAYVVMFFFLMLMGFSFWFLIDFLLNGTQSPAIMQQLFGQSIFFWMALLMVIPVLTMRLFAEERRSGTIETLMTAPVTPLQLVLSKYTGALIFYILLWAPTVSYAWALKYYNSSEVIDFGPMAGGYLGTLLVGAMFLAMGLLASACTRNQVVSAIACGAMIGCIFLIGFLPYVAHSESVRLFTGYISPVNHMISFSRGIVDTRPVLLYASTTLLFLFLTVRRIASNKWK